MTVVSHNPGQADTSTAAGKVLAVLNAFVGNQVTMSLAELAVRTALPKPTCHRLLGVLEGWGFVERTPDRRYRLTLKLFELGGVVQNRLRIRDVALPYMQDLVVSTREIVNLARLDGCEVLYLERLGGHQALGRCPSRLAGRMPASCTGIGKAILAFSPPELLDTVVSEGLSALTPYSITDPGRFSAALAEIRRTGVSYDYQESRLGLSCAAAPIFGAGGDVVAAMSVAGGTERLDVTAVAAAVRASALAVSRALGFRPAPPGAASARPAATDCRNVS